MYIQVRLSSELAALPWPCLVTPTAVVWVPTGGIHLIVFFLSLFFSKPLFSLPFLRRFLFLQVFFCSPSLPLFPQKNKFFFHGMEFLDILYILANNLITSCVHYFVVLDKFAYPRITKNKKGIASVTDLLNKKIWT